MKQLKAACDGESDLTELGETLNSLPADVLVVSLADDGFKCWISDDEQLNERQCEVIRLLLNRAVELSKRTSGCTLNTLRKEAFIYSGLIGDIDIATYFLNLFEANSGNQSELLMAKTEIEKKTVLHMACSMNKSDMVEFVLELSGKLDCLDEVLFDRDNIGNTALHSACSFSVLEASAAKAILDVIARQDAKVGDNTLLQKAMFQRNEYTDTPLGHACRHSCHDGATDTIKTLLSAVRDDREFLGKLMTESDSFFGFKPLHYAFAEETPEGASVLLNEALCDRMLLDIVTSHVNFDGDNALAYACYHGRPHSVKGMFVHVHV